MRLWQKIQAYSDNYFIRCFAKLSSGTFAAQIIQFLCWPAALTFYTPEDVGIYAVYTTIVGIVSVVSTGRYEMAIIAAKRKLYAKNLLYTAWICVGIATLVLLFLIWMNKIFFRFKIEYELELMILPIQVLCMGLLQALQYWFNRNKDFNSIVWLRITQIVGTSLCMLLLGYFHCGHGLIIASFLGILCSVILMAWQCWIGYINTQGISCVRIYLCLCKYKAYPQQSMLGAFLNTLGSTAENIIYPQMFSLNSVGSYYFSNRLTGVIQAYTAGNIWQTFISVVGGKPLSKILHTLKRYHRILVEIFTLPLLSIMVLANYLWPLVFNEAWQEAYQFFVVGVLFVYVNIIVTSFSLFVVINRPDAEMKFNCILFSLKVMVLLGAYIIGLDLLTTVILGSFLMAVGYVILGMWNYHQLGAGVWTFWSVSFAGIKPQLGYFVLLFFVDHWVESNVYGISSIIVLNSIYVVQNLYRKGLL